MNLVVNLVRKGLIKVEQIDRLKEYLEWGIVLLTPPAPESYDTRRDGTTADEYASAPKARRVPPIGDHAVIGRFIPDHYALSSVIFRQVDPVFADRLMGAWQQGGQGGEPYSNLPLLFAMLDEQKLAPVAPIDLHSRRLEGFGAVFRSNVNQPNENYLLFKQGPGGYRYHRTEGSILLFVDSKPLIYDGGEAGETWRHTTLSFYDTHLPMAAGHVERFFTSAAVDFCQGVHPTVIQPGQPVFLSDDCNPALVDVAIQRYHEPNPAIQRVAMWVKDQYAILHDDLRLDPSIPHHWHLQAVANTHTGDWRTGYLFNGRFGTDLQVLLPGQTFEDEKIEQVPTLEYHRPVEKCFAMRHLQLKSSATHYTAVLRPVDSSRPPVSAELLKQDGRPIGLHVTGEKIDDTLFLQTSARTVTAGRIQFTGRYGMVLRRPEGTHLIVIDGSTIETDRVRVDVTAGPVSLLIKPDGTTLAEGPGRFTVHARK
jgi:hypothetical protein